MGLINYIFSYKSRKKERIEGEAEKAHKISLFKTRERNFSDWTLTFKDRNPHYYKLFKVFYSNNVSVVEMIHLYGIINKRKHLLYILPKNTIHYTDYCELLVDLDRYITEYVNLVAINHVKHYMKGISKEDTRKMLKLSIEDESELFSHKLYYTRKFTKFTKFLVDNGLPKPCAEHRNKHISDYIDALKKNDCKILYNKDNIIITLVSNHKKMKCVGISSWCIKNKQDWRDMVKKKNTQLVIKDFNRIIDITFGVTLTKNFKIKHVYDEDNDERPNKVVRKYLNLIIAKKKLKQMK
jgi:hypothetical protein